MRNIHPAFIEASEPEQSTGWGLSSSRVRRYSARSGKSVNRRFSSLSVVLFRRPARRRGPEMPEGQLTLQEPPVLAETVPDTSAVWTYLPMALMSVSMMLMFLRPGGGNSVFMYLAMGVMALSMRRHAAGAADAPLQ